MSDQIVALLGKGEAIKAAALEARQMHDLAAEVRRGRWSNIFIGSNVGTGPFELSAFEPIKQFLPGIVANFCEERCAMMVHQANNLLKVEPDGSDSDENSDTVPPAADGPKTIIDPNWKAEADERQQAER
jgi:hypothetical protein